MKILFCITFLYRPQRLQYLNEILISASEWKAQIIDCFIFTERTDATSLSQIKRISEKFESENFNISISSHPEVTGFTRHLPWCHKNKMRECFEKNPEQYTHYIYTEDDIKITRNNLEYFCDFWEKLQPYGLLPGFVRYEYNKIENDIFNSDQHGTQNIADKARVMAGDYEFLTLNSPYAGAFIIDSRNMPEYLASRSSKLHESEKIVAWGEPERASMGLTWENVPQLFPCRVVVPLKKNTPMPDPICWLHHLPNNYTNDYSPSASYILGKTRMDSIFGDLEQPLRAWRFASCFSTNKIECEIYPKQYYQRKFPILIGEEKFISNIEDFYGEVNKINQQSPQSILSIIFNSFVFGSVVYTKTSEKMSILLETYRQNDRAFVNAPSIEEIIQKNHIHEPDLSNIYRVFIGSAGSFNYGHWLTDDLPRIESIFHIQKISPCTHIEILITSFNSFLDRIKEQSITKYLSGVENFSIKFLDHDKIYSFNRIYYVTPVVYHPAIKSPTAINKLHERITKNIKKTNLKRIFVSRCPPDQRFLRNHAEIENILSKLGFQTLIIRDQSFDEQVEFFSNAEIIVGCMGAAMTNIIFADSGTQIIMLAPEGWLEPYYWDLASVRNLKYAAIYGEPDNRALPAHQTSYEINPGKLVDFIQKLCPEYSF